MYELSVLLLFGLLRISRNLDSLLWDHRLSLERFGNQFRFLKSSKVSPFHFFARKVFQHLMSRRAFTTVIPTSAIPSTSAVALKLKTLPLFSETINSTKEVLLDSAWLEVGTAVSLDGNELTGGELRAIGVFLRDWFEKVRTSFRRFSLLLTVLYRMRMRCVLIPLR